jgi:Domain of unknown function (DUF4835)
MLKQLINVICLLCFGAISCGAQEFNCKVTLRHDKISGVDAKVFTTMEKSLNDFMNSHKWTTDEFSPAEKIDCNILINLVSNNVNSDVDAYSATMSIQATRPVYNTTYTTPLINYIDKDICFHFSQFNTLNFDDNSVSGTDPLASNITAILGYYSYLILGLDYDSFSPNGGTSYLKKAQNVVNNAPDGKGISGWKAVESTHNRYWIIDQMLNNRFSDVRSYWYQMHRESLDSMYYKPTEARTRMLVNLRKIFTVSRENPNSIIIQFFFNAKSDEIQHLLAQVPKQERGQYITMLTSMDVPNAPKYNALR